MANEQNCYSEVQWNTVKWVWALLAGIAALMWYGFYVQIIGGEPFGTNPAPDNVIILITVVFGALFPLFMLSMRLVTEVRDEGLHIRMAPFPGRAIPYDAIDTYAPRTYNALREYGGWGVRLGWNGKAYNMSGRDGIQLSLKSGESILVGTRHPEELYAALHAAMGGCAC